MLKQLIPNISPNNAALSIVRANDAEMPVVLRKGAEPAGVIFDEKTGEQIVRAVAAYQVMLEALRKIECDKTSNPTALSLIAANAIAEIQPKTP